jgi:hypothetical protein
MLNPTIELTNEELNLLGRIDFSSHNLEVISNSLEPMSLLTESLLARGVIPAVRLKYLSEPEFNPSGRGKSRIQVFEENGTPEQEISSHANFMRHLKYFIFGPDLPEHVVNDFITTVGSSGHISLRDIQDYRAKARAYVRESGSNAHSAAEEFFKLALEHGAQPSSAESLRSSVRQVVSP